MVIIALSGCDGSGKTTIAKKLLVLFRSLGFEVIYKHEYDYMILKYLFKLIGENRVEMHRKNMLTKRSRATKYYLWPLLVWLDALIQVVYFKICKRRKIVILDRYPYDHYLSFKYLGYLIKPIEWLYKMFPRADVNIVLWVHPLIAYERKRLTHNYDLDFYVKQTREYLRLARELHIPTINTQGSVAETLTKLLKVILSNKHFKSLLINHLKVNRCLCLTLKCMKLYDIDKDFATLFKACKMYEQILTKTLKRIVELERELNCEFILIKTFRPHYRVEYNDIDVMVKGISPNALLRGVSSINGTKARIESLHKIELYTPSAYPIELHWKLEWFKGFNLSIDINNEDYYFVQWFGTKVKVPKPMFEILIMLLHLAFGNATFMTLDDCLYMRYLLSRLTSNEMKRLIEKLKDIGNENIKLSLILLLRDMIRACRVFTPKPWFPPLRILFGIFIEELKYLNSFREICDYVKIFFIFNVIRRIYYELKLKVL